jgi:hypothetical protein
MGIEGLGCALISILPPGFLILLKKIHIARLIYFPFHPFNLLRTEIFIF